MNATQNILKQTIARRDAAVGEARSIMDAATIARRELTRAENTTIDAAFAEAATYDPRIAQLRSQLDGDLEAHEARSALPGDPRPDPSAGRGPSGGHAGDSLSAQVRAFARGELSHFTVPFGGEHRDLTKLSAGAGMNTVPTSFRSQLVEHLVAASAIRQTNATVLTTKSGEALQIPTTTAKSSALITAEAALIAESDPAFGQITLDAFKYAVVLQISNELLSDTGINIEALIGRQVGEALGNASGVHYVTGTGTGQPKGVVTSATTGVTGGAGVAGAFTAENLIDLQFSVLPAYRRQGYWFMSDTALAAVRKLKTTDGHFIFQPALTLGTPDMLLGRPVVTDPNVAVPALGAKSVLFGDFSRYMIRDVRGVEVERSADFAFTNDLMTYRAILRTDGELADVSGAVKAYVGNAA